MPGSASFNSLVATSLSPRWAEKHWLGQLGSLKLFLQMGGVSKSHVAGTHSDRHAWMHAMQAAGKLKVQSYTSGL